MNVKVKFLQHSKPLQPLFSMMFHMKDVHTAIKAYSFSFETLNITAHM